MQDTANLLTGPEKKKHQAALEGIDKSKLEYSGLKTGAVVAESCIAPTVPEATLEQRLVQFG